MSEAGNVVDDNFFGISTLGERGQVVIPAEARSLLGYKPGDKLLFIMAPSGHGMIMAKLDQIRDFLDDFAARIERAREEEINR